MIKNLILVLFSLVISWLVMNIYLFMTMAVDGRSRVTAHMDEWNKSQDIVPNLAPQSYARGDLHPMFAGLLPSHILFPLGGVPNTRVIYCEEDEGWMIEQTDRFGFFNPDKNWQNPIDIALVGDSFAQGACTNQHARYWLQKRTGDNVISLGMGGNGPLIEYASLRELLSYKPPTKTLWFVVNNDIRDIQAEREVDILMAYRDDPSFLQNYFEKDLLDYRINVLEAMPGYLERNAGNIESNRAEIGDPVYDTLSGRYLLERYNRHKKFHSSMSREGRFKREKIAPSENLSLTKEVMLRAHQDAQDAGVELTFVLIPEKHNCQIENQSNLFLDLAEFYAEHGMKYVDAFPITKSSWCDSIFATKRGGHLNSNGYSKLVQFLIAELGL